jgi:hypothetical protein
VKARVPVSIGVVVLIAIAVYWLFGQGEGRVDHTSPPTTARSATSERSVSAADATATLDAGTAVRPRRVVHTAAERTAMRDAITTARSRRTATVPQPPPTGTSAGDTSATTLDIRDRTGDTSAWEKRTLGVLNALLGECYDLGRAEDPKLEGKVKLRFTVVGEPKIGGLLETAEIVDDGFTTITQQTLRDCMTQQLHALELDPPPEGMRVEREVTLQFP